MKMHPPFPYYGGKRLLASSIWDRLGDVAVYAEPFAGSLAVLLASEPHELEIVCDTNGHIANFWRALRADPDELAYWADYPTIHQDLLARHKCLVKWQEENCERLCEDPDWYDTKCAGWWVWGSPTSWEGDGA